MGRVLPPDQAPVIMRAIHASADFDYAENLYFSPGALETGLQALKEGASIVTDTNMAFSGLSKPAPESPVREPELAPPDVPHPLVQALRDVDPDVLTPLAALKLLSEWKMLWGKNDEKTV